MKKLVICVTGWEWSLSKSEFKKRLVRKLYKHSDDDWIKDLEKDVRKKLRYDFIRFEWYPSILKKNIIKSGLILKNLIRRESKKYKEIVLVGRCYGAEIIKIALKNYVGNVKKVVYLGSPHKSGKNKLSEKIKVVNVYSKNDLVAKWVNRVFHFRNGLKLKNAENIDKDLSHYEMVRNKALEKFYLGLIK